MKNGWGGRAESPDAHCNLHMRSQDPSFNPSLFTHKVLVSLFLSEGTVPAVGVRRQRAQHTPLMRLTGISLHNCVPTGH